MFYYLLHQSSLWKNEKLTDGQRNVRILFIALVLYVVIYAISFEYKNKSVIFKIINKYFFIFMAIDVIVSACLYKTYYGRSIFNELRKHETDTYDEKTHQYHDKNMVKTNGLINDAINDNESKNPTNEKNITSEKDIISEKNITSEKNIISEKNITNEKDIIIEI